MNEELSYTDQPWVKNYPDNVSTHIEYHRKTIPELLERSAEKYPDNIALIFEGYELQYKTLKNMVDQFSNYLIKLNIQQGDCVALILPNVIPCVVGYLGILQVGAIAVFINPTSSDREMEHQLNDSEASMIITLDLICNRIIDLRPRLVNVHYIIYTSLGDYLPF